MNGFICAKRIPDDAIAAGNRLFRIIDEPNDEDASWADARHRCRETAADLAVFDTRDQLDLVRVAAFRKHVTRDLWIGLHDKPEPILL